MPENPADNMTQNAKAKSPKAQLVAQIARLVKKAGLDYEGWRYVSKRVRRLCDLRPEKKGRRLPRVLTTEEFRRFYQMVDRAEDVQHCPDAQAPVLHGGAGSVNSATSESPKLISKPARSGSTRARAPRIATSSSASPSPRR